MARLVIIFLLASVLCSSCNKNVHHSLSGTYDRRGRDFYYRLTIDDSSFILLKKYSEVNAECKGSWHRLTNDSILLQCDDVGVVEKLQRGYVSAREQTAVLLTRNRLRIGTVVLRRKRK